MRNRHWDNSPRQDTSNLRSKNTGRRTQIRCGCDGCATSSDRATPICSCGKQRNVRPASSGFLECACPVGTSPAALLPGPHWLCLVLSWLLPVRPRHPDHVQQKAIVCLSFLLPFVVPPLLIV